MIAHGALPFSNGGRRCANLKCKKFRKCKIPVGANPRGFFIAALFPRDSRSWLARLAGMPGDTPIRGVRCTGVAHYEPPQYDGAEAVPAVCAVRVHPLGFACGKLVA
jgi:hypothetical protein